MERPLELTLDDLAKREPVTTPVTMECAGNGRAQLEPHVVSQPWLAEAIGTAEWTGVPLAALLSEAAPAADALEVVFTGLDHGVEGGVEQDYARSLSLADCEGALLAYAVNGVPLPPQHGFPLRLVVPGWYGMTSVKWLQRITVVAEPFEGYQMVTGYRMKRDDDDPGHAGHADRAALADDPAGHPRLHDAAPLPAAGAGAARGPRLVRLGADRARRGRHRRRLGSRRSSATRPGPPPGRRGGTSGTRPRASTSCAPAPPTPRGRSQPDAPRVERRRLRQQRDPARAGHRPLEHSATAGARSARCPNRAT